MYTNQLYKPVIPSGLIYPYHLDESILCWKTCAYTEMSEKWGLSYINKVKSNRVSHIYFFPKRRLIIYPAAVKKGVIRHAHPFYAIFRKLPPPTPRPPLPPPPPPNTHRSNDVSADRFSDKQVTLINLNPPKHIHGTVPFIMRGTWFTRVACFYWLLSEMYWTISINLNSKAFINLDFQIP